MTEQLTVTMTERTYDMITGMFAERDLDIKQFVHVSHKIGGKGK